MNQKELRRLINPQEVKRKARKAWLDEQRGALSFIGRNLPNILRLIMQIKNAK